VGGGSIKKFEISRRTSGFLKKFFPDLSAEVQIVTRAATLLSRLKGISI
jgi:hypothetical protein